MPISKKTSLALPTAPLIPTSEMVPEYPYKNAAPNKKNADAYAPNKKYFRADSCDSNRRLRAAKLTKEAAPVRQRDASAPHLDERAARERAGARVHAVRRTHLVLEARAAARVLLLVERERDDRDARRVRGRDAVHLGRARPRRGDRARVEAAPHVAELRRARREAAASHVHKGAAAHRPAHRLERAQRHRPQILKVHARRTEVAPVGAHLERHVPRRRRARRGALELPG